MPRRRRLLLKVPFELVVTRRPLGLTRVRGVLVNSPEGLYLKKERGSVGSDGRGHRGSDPHH
jgi:hypothetical protein